MDADLSPASGRGWTRAGGGGRPRRGESPEACRTAGRSGCPRRVVGRGGGRGTCRPRCLRDLLLGMAWAPRGCIRGMWPGSGTGEPSPARGHVALSQDRTPHGMFGLARVSREDTRAEGDVSGSGGRRVRGYAPGQGHPRVWPLRTSPTRAVRAAGVGHREAFWGSVWGVDTLPPLQGSENPAPFPFSLPAWPPLLPHPWIQGDPSEPLLAAGKGQGPPQRGRAACSTLLAPRVISTMAELLWEPRG